MRESDLKRKLVKEVNDLPGGYARRIEDRWSVGALDMFIKLPGRPAIWAEGKVIVGNVFAPTLRQYEEGKRLRAAGVEAVLIGWSNGMMYVSPWTKKADKRDCYTAVLERNYATILMRCFDHVAHQKS